MHERVHWVYTLQFSEIWEPPIDSLHHRIYQRNKLAKEVNLRNCCYQNLCRHAWMHYVAVWVVPPLNSAVLLYSNICNHFCS